MREEKGEKMSIEIGSKWVKDGEVVKVLGALKNSINYSNNYVVMCIWFKHQIKADYYHVLTERDFLEQYKPYDEFVYRWVYVVNNAIYFTDEKMTHDEFEKAYIGEKVELYACISETKEKR